MRNIDYQNHLRQLRRLKSPKSPDWKRQSGKERRAEERANLCAVNAPTEGKKSVVDKVQQFLTGATFAGLSSLHKRLRKRRMVLAGAFLEWKREHGGALDDNCFPNQQDVRKVCLAWGLLNSELRRRNIKTVAWKNEETVAKLEELICV